ncbi:hypothetical protein, partial [Plasmodium yoelii yoelii]
MNCVTYFI